MAPVASLWAYCANIVPNSGYKRLKNRLTKTPILGSLKKLRKILFYFFIEISIEMKISLCLAFDTKNSETLHIV